MNMENLQTKMSAFLTRCTVEFKNSIRKVSIDSIGWTALIALHAVTVPSLLGLMTGLTDNTPPIDMVIILWAALGLFYIKSILERNFVALNIIGFGFIGQSILMALIFFK